MRVPLALQQWRAFFVAPLAIAFIAIACRCGASAQDQSNDIAKPAAPLTRMASIEPASSPPDSPDEPVTAPSATTAFSSQVILKADGAKVNSQVKSAEMLAHLTEITRNYRMSVALTQKVGEPVDASYREQSITNAKLVASYAFQAGSAAARLLTAYTALPLEAERKQSQSEFQRMQEALSSVNEKIENLKAEQKMLEAQLGRVPAKHLKEARTRLEQTQAALNFDVAIGDALIRIAGMSDTHSQSGFDGEIERLKQTAPGITDLTVKVVPAPLAALDVARSSGIMSQASALFQLLATREALDEQSREIELLHRQALSLRTPLSSVLMGMIHEEEALSQQVVGTTTPSPSLAVQSAVASAQQQNAVQAQNIVAQLDAIAAAFKTLGASAIPLSQEIIALERSGANLSAWRTAVNGEYRDARRSLLERLLVIVGALGLILVGDIVWQRASFHYVTDLRRRRQLLGIRRLVTFFLYGVVLVFGFVTRFNSFATFAGFITAGLAVALQTILLSVAAYFFVVGRYGIRIGDRVSVASVTGDVIDVGLLRFYLMELAMSGLGFQPTGRVAVFSNAILFQAGTPLYKQMPGTDYAWHEMTVMLKEGGDYTHTVQALLGAVQHIYDGYKQEIEEKYNGRQSTMDYGMNAPRIQSRLQLVGGGGPQLTVRFPVKVQEASRITQNVAEAMLQLIDNDDSLKQAVESQPVITAAVKC